MRVAVAVAASVFLVACGGGESALPEVTPIAEDDSIEVYDPISDCVGQIAQRLDEAVAAPTDAHRSEVYRQAMLEWGGNDPRFRAFMDLSGVYMSHAYQDGIDQAIEEVYPMVVDRCSQM